MSLQESLDSAHPLVDPRTGLITRMVRQPHRPGLPRALISYVAHVGAVGRVTGWSPDPHTHGAALDDPAGSWWPALGEAVERYCGNAVPQHLRRARYAELARDGVAALDPAAVALYSSAQYTARGFPFVPLTADREISWVQGTRLADASPMLVPASLAYLNFYVGARAAEPPAHSPMYAGIAAGPTLQQAQRSASEELIERDAVAIWWHSGGPAAGVDVADEPRIDALRQDPAAAGLTYHLVAIPHRTGVPVLGALVTDPDRGLVAFGSACRADPGDAAVKAVTEALGLLQLAVDLADPDSPLWQAIDSGAAGRGVLRPFRADRRYLDDYGPHWRAMTDLPANTQLFLDPRMHGDRIDRLRPPVTTGLTELPGLVGPPSAAEQDPRASLLDRLAQAGFDPVSVDLTTDDVAAAGVRVARVIVPGLYGNAPAAFPLLGGERLRTEPARLGLAACELTDDQLVLDPLPFT